MSISRNIFFNFFFPGGCDTLDEMTEFGMKLKHILLGDLLGGDTDQYVSDFGRLFKRQPDWIIRPAHVEDAIRAMKECADSKVSLSLWGTGHSTGGRCLSNDGVLFDTTTPEHEGLHLHDNGFVSVDASITIGELLKRLAEENRTLPVYPESLEATIGGVIASGGLGPASIRNGYFSDHVESLEIIRPDGSALTCSVKQNEVPFRLTLSGLGMTGWIRKALLHTAPMGDLYLYKISHKDKNNLISIVNHLAAMPPHELPAQFSSWIIHDRIQTELVYPENSENLRLKMEEFLASTEKMGEKQKLENPPEYWNDRWKRWATRFQDDVRLWSEYFFPVDRFEDLLDILEVYRIQEEVRPFLKGIHIRMVRREESKGQLAFLPDANSPVIAVSLHHMIHRWNPKSIIDASKILREALHEFEQIGGRPYLWSYTDPERPVEQYMQEEDRKNLHNLREENHLSILNRQILQVETSD